MGVLNSLNGLRKASSLGVLLSFGILVNHCVFCYAVPQGPVSTNPSNASTQETGHHDHKKHCDRSGAGESPEDPSNDETCCTTIKDKFLLENKPEVSSPYFKQVQSVDGLDFIDEPFILASGLSQTHWILGPPGRSSPQIFQFLPAFNRPPPVLL